MSSPTTPDSDVPGVPLDDNEKYCHGVSSIVAIIGVLMSHMQDSFVRIEKEFAEHVLPASSNLGKSMPVSKVCAEIEFALHDAGLDLPKDVQKHIREHVRARLQVIYEESREKNAPN